MMGSQPVSWVPQSQEGGHRGPHGVGPRALPPAARVPPEGAMPPRCAGPPRPARSSAPSLAWGWSSERRRAWARRRLGASRPPSRSPKEV